LNREEEELLKKFAEIRGEKMGDGHVKNHDGSRFSKFRDAFNR